MKYHNYEVDPAFLTEGLIKWKITGSGTWFLGKRDSQKYMVKRYITIRYPDPSLPKPTYDMYMEEFKAIRSKQNAIKKAFERYDWRRDHIVTEVDNFNDEENYYVVVTPWINGAVPSDYPFKRLSFERFVAMAKEMAEEIRKIHAVGVIHSDLKIENFCYVEDGPKLTPYLVDFDLSFMVGKAPAFDVVGGSLGYQAPELLEYQYSEDDSLGNRLLTPAIDVFALGITFHCLYADRFPDCAGHETAGDALNAGANVTVDPLFDRPIGPKHKVSFKALLEAMFVKDFSRRIKMEQVVQVLSDEADLTGAGAVLSVDFEEPWPEDGIEYVAPEELPAGHKFRSVKRAPNRHYKIIKTNGIPSFGDRNTLISLGLARPVGSSGAAPTSPSAPAPSVPTPPPAPAESIVDDCPWPEDAAGGFSYNIDNIRAKGILSIKKEVDGGAHKYRIVYSDHTLLMPGNMVKITRLITK